MKRVCTFFIILIALSCWTSVADAQTIRMPDANLAALVRNELELAPNAPITRQVMQRLISLSTPLTSFRAKIKDLTGLEHATQLRYLFLDNNQISDIRPLAGLTQLESLSMERNQISDIGPLARLTQLSVLRIDDNPITNFRPLAGLTQLKLLSVGVAKVSDLRQHVNLTRLEVLALDGSGNQIEDLHLLSNLTQLRTLHVDDAQIRDLSFLERLTQLRELALFRNEISDLKPLAGLTQLKILYLRNNQIRDVAPLAGLVNLELLLLNGNPIQDASPLAALTKLSNVDIEIPDPPPGATTAPASTGNEVIPDANLAAMVRDALGLAPGAPITRQAMQRLTSLNAQGYKVREVTGQEGWIENITGLEHATQLQILFLSGNRIRDIRLLSRLTRLKTLSIWNNEISDIGPLAGLKQLTSLKIFGNPINDFGPLAGLVQLRDLRVSVQRIGDLRRHVDLTQLESLQVFGSGNRIEDLHLLANLTQLTYLDIASARIRDLSFLERLTQLIWLGLSPNEISDLKPIANLTQLIWLSLGRNQISDLQPLAGLTQLIHLSLWNNQIRDVTPLARLVNLEVLRLKENPIQDASPLAALTRLRDVDIEIPDPPPGATTGPASTSNVVIPDAKLAAAVRKALGLGSNAPITEQAMQKLTNLEAHQSDIKDLTGLEHATKLTRLKLWDNKINDITPIAGLTQLRNLDVGVNKISNITALAELTQLELLGLWNNQISDINALSKLTRLKEIWLQANQVRDVTPLSKLVQLKELFLQANQVRDVTPLAGLVKLETLFLTDNPIQDTSPLRTLLDRNPNLKLDIEISQPSVVVQVGASERPPMYWINVNSGTLHRLVGAEVENLVPGVRNATGLAIDVAGGKLYWTEKTSNTTGKIRRANLDGRNVQLVKELKSVPHGIALDAAGRKLYWTASSGKIKRANLNGSGSENVVPGGLESPKGLALDVSGGKVYWTEMPGRIRRANLDGSNVEGVVATDSGTPMNLVVFDGTVYWTQKTGENLGEIRFVAMDGNSGVVTRNTFTQGFPVGIALDAVENKLYWTTSRGEIGRSTLGGSDFQPNLVTGLSAPGAFVLNVEPTLVIETPVAATTDTDPLKAIFEGHTDIVWSVAISPDSKTIASAGWDKKVRLWDTETKQHKISLILPEAVMSVAFSPDGQTLASGSWDGTIRLWNPQTGKLQRTLTGHTDGIESVAFSPDGQTLASGSADQTIRLWDTHTGKLQKTLTGQERITSIAFSPDGQMLASGSADQTVRLWNPRTGKLQRTLTGHTDWVTRVTFSPDSKTLASGGGSDDRTLRLWNPQTGKLKKMFTGYTDQIRGIAFSPDGRILASSGWDQKIRLWNTETGKYEKALEGHRGGVISVVFSPDERTLASGGKDGKVYQWDVQWLLDERYDAEVETDTPVVAATDAVLSISPASVISPAVGEQLTLNLNITAGEAVAGYQVTLRFDPTALRYVESSNGDYLPDGAFFLQPVVNRDRVELASSTLTGVSNGGGTLATVTFEVMVVKASTLTLSDMLLSDSKGNTFLPRVEAAEITEPPELTADINGDGVVNIQDLVLVASNFGKTGENAADVNTDGVVNIADLVLVAGSLGMGLGAPSLYPGALEMFTAADVREWLSQAHRLNSSHVDYQRGLLVLEQLLTALAPKETLLLPNYPNPFNPETWIPYQLAMSSDVKITIYDARGIVVRRLELGYRQAGYYTNRSRSAYWDGRNALGEPVASGVYFYHLEAEGVSLLRKMVTLK